MTEKTVENLNMHFREYTYEELMETFLAGSRMASEHHMSWQEAFDKWITQLEKNRNNALGLS